MSHPDNYPSLHGRRYHEVHQCTVAGRRPGRAWLHGGSEMDRGVDFQRMRLDVALGQYARDGQHRHGEQ